MKSKFAQFIVFTIISFVLIVGTSIFQSGLLPFLHAVFSAFISLLIFYVYGRLSILKFKSLNHTFLIIGVILSFVVLYVFILDFTAALGTFPISIAKFLGFILAFIPVPKKSLPKFTLYAMIIGVAYVGAYVLYPKYHHYRTFKSSEGNMANLSVPFQKLTGFNKDLVPQEITLEKGHYYIFDLWHSSCGVCFKEFSTVEALQDKYGNEKVHFLSLNYPLKRDSLPELSTRVNKKWNLDFFYIQDTSFYNQEPFVKAFPSFYIINDKQEFIFSGRIDKLKVKLEEMWG